MLAGLGAPVWLTGFSRGIVGQEVNRILGYRGIETEFVEARGTARINVVLKDLSGGWQSTITAPGLEVRKEHEKKLLLLVSERLPLSTCLVLGGSLPQGCSSKLYSELIRAARREDVPCVLDTSGPPLREAVKAQPTAVKPNRHEASELWGREIIAKEDALIVAEELHRIGISWVVISLGVQGLVAFGEGRAWYASPPPLDPKSTAGAGDAIVAGLALGLARSWGIMDSLRWGLSLAAALMEKESVLECDFERVPFWLKRIYIQPC
jgi:1-phosphofructokinase